MINQLTAGLGAIYGTSKGNQSLNPALSEGIEAGINPLNIPALKKFAHQKNVEKISSAQASYQKTRQEMKNALGMPKPLEANKPKTISADLGPGPVNVSNIRGGVPIPPPSNTQGNAKPLFDPAFEKKASFLAGSEDQATAAGY